MVGVAEMTKVMARGCSLGYNRRTTVWNLWVAGSTQRRRLPQRGNDAIMIEDHRMARERETVEAMIALYCCGNHDTRDAMCAECETLRDYARQRLASCPFQAEKPTCAKCPVHCYKPAMREQVKAVMRYAGPRMIYRHPLKALRHLADGRRKAPATPRRVKAVQRSGR